jgi:hypothetical protein
LIPVLYVRRQRRGIPPDCVSDAAEGEEATLF